MSWSQWVLDVGRDVLLPILTVVVLPLVIFYLRDRRKSRAESVIAERTIGSDVATKDLGAASATVAFVQEAFRIERESKDREIRTLTEKLANVERGDELKDAKIRALEDAEIEKDRVIHDLTRQVRSLTSRLERLEGEQVS